MSNGIRGRGPTDLPPPRPNLEETQEAQQKTPATPEATTAKEQAPLDRFERKGGAVGAQLQSRLQALAGKVGANAAKVQFSNEDLAYLANTFAALIRDHPGA